MKRICIAAFLGLWLLAPSTTFAETYGELFLGAGRSEMTHGEYTVKVLDLEHTSPYTFTSKSTDFIGGFARFSSSDSIVSAGTGMTITVPIDREQTLVDDGPGGILSPVILSVDFYLRFNLGSEAFITVEPSALLAFVGTLDGPELLIGPGFSASIGPSFRLGPVAGLSAQVGYRYISTGMVGWLFIFPFECHYTNEGWYAGAFLTFRTK